MWTRVTPDDAAGLQRHVALMQQMDHGYGLLSPRDLVRSLLEERGELWHYQGNGFEIGMLFQYSWDRGQWQLAQVGFQGQVQPAAVADLNVAQAKQFCQAHGTDAFFCGVPLRMDYAPLLEYYALCKQHPQLRVTIIHQAATKEIWQIQFAAP